MRIYVISILVVLLASIVLLPMVEMAIVYREKIVLDSALRNSSKVAKDISLQREAIQNLDAEIDEEVFITYFSDTFEDVMNVYNISTIGNTMTFTSNDGKYDSLTVNLTFDREMRLEGVVTSVRVKANATYNFKTKLMQLAQDMNPAIDYQLESEREYKLTVTN